MIFKYFKSRYGAILLLVASTYIHSYTQDIGSEAWFAYITDIAIDDHWKVWNDYSYITNTLGLARVGLTYQTKTGYQLTGGYAYTRSSTESASGLVRKENRLWGQLMTSIELRTKLNYTIRLRYDARFRERLDAQNNKQNEPSIFNHRFRVMQDLRYRLSNNSYERYWHIDIINEVLVNSGRSVDNGIDQIRSYLMLGYTHKNVTVLAGAHQRYIPSPTKNWKLNHGATIWVIHHFFL